MGQILLLLRVGIVTYIRPGAIEILFRVRDRLIPAVSENFDPFLTFDPFLEKFEPAAGENFWRI